MLITHPCRVAVVGSRTYWDLKAVRDFITQLPEGCTVISGGARGVDQTAEQAARARGILVQIYPADWH
ncbi:MAG: SLOG family protein [Cyanobacteriota bacterium]|nr:SLOG family protein [Cyanobacteriota bacterium]